MDLWLDRLNGWLAARASDWLLMKKLQYYQTVIALNYMFSSMTKKPIKIPLLVLYTTLFWDKSIIDASEARGDTIFDDSRTTRAPAEGKNPVLADIIGSQTKMLWAG